jgi:CRP/FNR family cyclic AMP-dependent transcriptional regulator
MGEQIASLRAQPFLRGLPPGYADLFVSAARDISLPARHRLFEEGGTADRFWLIDAGQVALDVLVPGQGRMILEILGRGDVLGLSWLHHPYQWRDGAFTTQPTQAIEFDARAVRAACGADPAFGYDVTSRFMAVAMHRLQATRARLIEARRRLPADRADV